MKLSISPSVFARVAQCPGSAQLSADITVVPSPAMERGTALHKELEDTFLGRIRTENPAVAEACRVLLEVRKQMALKHNLTVKEWVEARLDFKWLGLNLDPERGRVDYAFAAGDEGWVIDFKTGRGDESYDHPGESWQLLLYACALARLPENADVESWNLAYLAPERAEGEHFVVQNVHRDILHEYAGSAKETVKLAKSKTPVFNTGTHCKWCPAKSRCHKLQESAVSVLPEGALSKPGMGAAFLAATPTERAKMWETVLEAESFVESLKAELIKHATEVPVDGYMVRPSRVDKRWSDPDLAERVLAVALGEKAYESKLISPSAALKLGFVDDSGLIVNVPAALALKKEKGGSHGK